MPGALLAICSENGQLLAYPETMLCSPLHHLKRIALSGCLLRLIGVSCVARYRVSESEVKRIGGECERKETFTGWLEEFAREQSETGARLLASSQRSVRPDRILGYVVFFLCVLDFDFCAFALFCVVFLF